MARMVTDEQVAFLRDRFSEDEASAKAACLFGSGNWVQDDPGRYPGHIDSDTGTVTYDEGSPTHDQAAHIARHNPARVLRDVEVWRRILLEYGTAGLDAKYAGTERETGFQLALSFALKSKAAVYKDHPDYGRLFG
jgi:hypothetical protein